MNVENHPYNLLRTRGEPQKNGQKLANRLKLFKKIEQAKKQWNLTRKGMTFFLPHLEHAAPVHSSGWGAIFCTAQESFFLEEQILSAVGMKRELRMHWQGLKEPLPVALFNQTHSNYVFVVKDHKTLTFPYDHQATYFPKGDGVAASFTNWIFVIRTADCIPLLFHSEDGKIWGGLHVSWRSLQAGILEHTFLSLLPLQFLTQPNKLSIYLGPSIMQECYPVGIEVLSAIKPFLKAYGIRQEQVLKPITALTENTSRAYLNLPELCARILMGLGVQDKKIVYSKLCTACNGNFFSHRAHATPYRNWNLVFKVA